ncbi:MAG: histidine phosphatase family protein [Lachnospiraceae bacterium]|nr:histidine phosphatase family protein [Lachnospiraceae bacterium]
MRIYLVRHARQCSPLCNVNVELAQEGVQQAELLAARMKMWIPVDAIYSSALLRARQTAGILGQTLKIEPKPGDAAVNEIEFGELTGLSDHEINVRYGAFMEQRRALLADLAFPGGECGADVFARAYPFLLAVAKSGHEHAVIVTHGGTIRAILAGVLHMEQRFRLALTKTLENTSVTILEYNGHRDWFTVETVNDYAHLAGHPELMRSAIKR